MSRIDVLSVYKVVHAGPHRASDIQRSDAGCGCSIKCSCCQTVNPVDLDCSSSNNNIATTLAAATSDHQSGWRAKPATGYHAVCSSIRRNNYTRVLQQPKQLYNNWTTVVAEKQQQQQQQGAGATAAAAAAAAASSKIIDNSRLPLYCGGRFGAPIVSYILRATAAFKTGSDLSIDIPS